MNVDTLIEPARVSGRLYTDAESWARELQRIWYGGWVYVGHESEVPEPGDSVAKVIGPRRVLLRHGPAIDGVPNVDSVCGFVFACCAPEAPCTLAEHLGDAASTLHRLASPKGRVRLDRGWLQHAVSANWKMLLENEVDGYHPSFVHASIFSIAKGPLSDLFGDKSSAGARELGRGHSELALTAQFRAAGTLSWVGSSPERMPEYMAAMRAAYSEDGIRRVTNGPPHVMIFPNLFIAEIQIFVIQPTALNETVQRTQPARRDSAAIPNGSTCGTACTASTPTPTATAPAT